MQPDLKESASRKSILRKFCERLEGAGRYFEGLNGTVFTLYATFVFSVDAIASDYFSPKFIPAAIFFIATTAAAVCPAIIRFFSKNSIAENSFAKKKLAKNGMKKQLAATRKPAKHVSDNPAALALTDERHPRGLSRRQVDELSGRVYAWLKAKKVGREDFVFLCLPRHHPIM